MSRLSDRGYSAADATEAEERVFDAHHLRVKVDSWKFTDAGAVLLASDVPVVSGRLIMDSSAPIRRELSFETAGEEYIPTDENSPLVPFGQAVVLYNRIDRRDGSWFPWMKMGEFVVTSNVVERPSNRISIDASDYSAVLDEYRFTRNKSYKGRTLASAVSEMARDSLPNRVFAIHSSSHAQTSTFANYVANASRSRWDVAEEMASKKGQEVLFDWNGDLVIRYDRTQDDEETIPGVGPDIGTVSNPVAVIKEGEGGNLVGLTGTVTRRGGMNGVAINLSATVKRRKKSVEINHHELVEQSSGPAAWGDAFGRIPIVQQDNVDRINDSVKNDRRQKAQALLRRRLGVVRYLDMDVAPIYWLEPDDTIKVQWAGRTEYHFVQRVEIDLAGKRPMRVRTRQLSVTDPG